MGGSNGDSTEATYAVPKFALSEISLGRSIGQGGFSIVSQVRSMELREMHDPPFEADRQRRRDFAASVQRHNQNYVLKTLRNDLPEEEHIKGIIDLAIEAEFLANLSHPNIIAMRALSNSDPHQSHFFVILDRLRQTLDLKFNEWRKMVGLNSGYWIPCYGYCCAKAVALFQTWKERLTVARDIALAIQYLHARNIIYRDLKPDNIGFDSEGVLKVFDFGLAKRLDEVPRTQDGMYLLTGNTGSLRYMAPEVALDKPYNLSADAFSFGIIFWQICSLTTPFAGFSQKMHADRVVRGGERPKPDPSWPTSWVNLMEETWTEDTLMRPSFDVIVELTNHRLNELIEEDGVVPSRAAEIRAKKRKKKVRPENKRLDVDTRIASGAPLEDSNESTTLTRAHNDIV